MVIIKSRLIFFVGLNVIFKFSIDKVPRLLYTSGGQLPLCQYASASQHGCLWTVGVSDWLALDLAFQEDR